MQQVLRTRHFLLFLSEKLVYVRTVVGNKSEYGCVFATVISSVLVSSAESSNLELPQNNFFFYKPLFSLIRPSPCYKAYPSKPKGEA